MARVKPFLVPTDPNDQPNSLILQRTGTLEEEVARLGRFRAWTPTYANLTVGNGTEIARYMQIGKLVHCWYELTFGSTSSVSGDVTVSLPVDPHPDYSNNENTVGHALFRDATGSRLTGVVHISTGSVVRLRASNSGATYLSESALSSTVPFTWTTSDVLFWQATYEAD